ncbi:HNH endonuclease [Acinetobacter corruptisaponis]|uniref:HNH endonuclease n=1 Tax=Acinetobacter corruptisaponis TaxID=3045147 RepID=A0ABY8S7U5_9GAMM|nr:HNH endonuclease [Acinetobacter sp. KCTC 92772]WHP06788.1 HNH endonuclease [Acinetobacter sp. KCTC 92772]
MKNKITAFHPNMARDNTMLQEFVGKRLFDRHKNKFKPEFKYALWLASNKQCAYCGKKLQNSVESRVDHFEPKSRFDNEHINNYVCACVLCNTIKGNADIEEFRFRFAFYNSDFRGVVSPSQAISLINMGIEFPVETELFHFEKFIITGANHE